MKINLPVLTILCLMMNCTAMKIPSYTVKEQDIKDANQLMVVVAEDWHSIRGTLHLYERGPGGWEKKGASIPVTLGKNGMAWGNGIVQYEDGKGLKMEGDSKTPAGAYQVEFVYGYAEPHEAAFIKLPYMMCNEMLKCVDDAQSKYYNKIVSEDILDDKDWESAEDMKRDDDLYKWGIVVDYNFTDPQAGAGSCIFIHLWRSPDSPTAGCTAMGEGDMLKVLEWLDPEEKPVIAQFPKTVYEELRGTLGLPGL